MKDEIAVVHPYDRQVPEYRTDGRTGHGRYLTQHQWRVLNGYELPYQGEKPPVNFEAHEFELWHRMGGANYYDVDAEWWEVKEPEVKRPSVFMSKIRAGLAGKAARHAASNQRAVQGCVKHERATCRGEHKPTNWRDYEVTA